VTGSGDEFRCGGWTARLAGDPGGDGQGAQLEISGSGEGLDGLRALCAAAWSAGPVSADSVRSAVAQLPLPG
jgi:glycerol-1-phosphatase